jgi:hypothetical protein
MANTFTSTGTYANLTRLELEQLRRADYAAGGKALTVGDSANGVENVVGKGNVNAEPYQTEQFIALSQLANVTPPVQPGLGLSTTTHVWGLASESVSWVGPMLIWDGSGGYAIDSGTWGDATDSGIPTVDWTTIAQAGDIVLIKSQAVVAGSAYNNNTVAVVGSVTATGLVCSLIFNPSGPDTDLLVADPSETGYSFCVVRPNAVQLFAVPGSGPTGREQSFMMVKPTSTLHSTVGPTIDQINADRIQNIVPPNYALNSTVDRADAVYSTPSPLSTLDKLGYRVVLYPDNGNPNPALRGPDLAHPIATLNPIIDQNIPLADQRMTFDFAAGVVRFSCAPNVGGDIKPNANCVNGTTGRLNLYAVFWAVDNSLTQSTARGLYAIDSTAAVPRAPGRMYWDGVHDRWMIGSRGEGRGFQAYIQANMSDPSLASFGVSGLTDPTGGTYNWDAYFGIRLNKPIFGDYMTPGQTPVFNPWYSNGQYLDQTRKHFEMILGVKDGLTMGDNTNPPARVGLDQYPALKLNFSSPAHASLRTLDYEMDQVLTQAATSPVGRVKLFKGHYLVTRAVHVPPGVTLEGEGNQTVIELSSAASGASPALKFGPNTPWGVYDFDWDENSSSYNTASTFHTLVQTKVEGMDIVWNSVKRVWGLAWADLTANAIWFNEMRPDGTFVYPDFGVNLLIQTTGNPGPTSMLWSSDSVGSIISGNTHTPGHYPRIDFNPELGIYAAAWVQADAAQSGPQVRVVQFVIGDYDPSTAGTPPTGSPTPPSITWVGSSGKEGVLLGTTSHEWLDHPSIKFGGSGDTYLYISSWSRIWIPVSDSHIRTDYWDAINNIQSTHSGANINGGKGVISSTDITGSFAGTGLVVWSERPHDILTGTAGYVDNSGSPTTAATFQDDSIANLQALVELGGSKLHVLGYTSTMGNNPGNDYVICGFPGSTNKVYVRPENSLDAVIYEGPGGPAHILTWAITPRSAVKVATLSCTSTIEVTQNAPDVTGTVYVREMREADFVRVSQANGNYLLVFQAMNTTGYLSKYSIANFDNNVNSGFIDKSNSTLTYSQSVYREHIGTCSVLLGVPGFGGAASVLNPTNQDRSQLTYSGDATDHTVDEAQFIQQSSKVPATSAKSLGASDPLTTRPNLLFFNYIHLALSKTGGDQMQPWGLNRGYHLEISARHIVHKWTTSKAVGLIPDLTWTGQDWMIVSPTQCRLASDTGTIIVSGGNTYLCDSTFYFGSGASNAHDRNYLLNTIERVYFPSTGQSSLVTVDSEHVVRLLTPPSISTGTKVNWVAVASGVPGTLPSISGPGSMDTHLKNLSYRVAANGDLIQGSSRLTDAFQHSWHEYGRRFATGRAETVSRRSSNVVNIGTGGANLPMSIGVLVPQAQDTYDFGTACGYGGLGYPTSRISGEIGFSGAVAGSPKPYGIALLDDCPILAIAWGESFYALMDRLDSGSVGDLTSKVVVFRQSMGPYQASAKTLKVISNRTTQLNWDGVGPYIGHIETRRHIHTRFGLPAASATGLATDGYRNCYVYPKQVSTPKVTTSGPDPRFNYNDFDATDFLDASNAIHGGPTHKIRWYSKITNFAGDGGIESEGPSCAYFSPEQVSMPIGSEALLGTTTYPYSTSLAFADPSCPKVIWNGKRFVAFWTEEVRSANKDGIVGSINMASFVGGEDTYRVDGSLSTPFEASPYEVSTAVISCGMGMTRAATPDYDYPKLSPEIGQIYVCDAAYSGDNYCVAWIAGVSMAATIPGGDPVNPGNDFDVRAGCVLGVSFFSDNTGMRERGTSVVLQTDTTPTMHNPKIVWDGTNYVVFFNKVIPASQGTVQFISVPKSGFSSEMRVVKVSGSAASTGNSGKIGTVKAAASLASGTPGGIVVDQPVGPGDTIVVQKTQLSVTISDVAGDASATTFQNTFTTSSLQLLSKSGDNTWEIHLDVVNRAFQMKQTGTPFDWSTLTPPLIGARLTITTPTTGGQGVLAAENQFFTVVGFGAPAADNTWLRVVEPLPYAGFGGVIQANWAVETWVHQGDLLHITGPSKLAGTYVITDWIQLISGGNEFNLDRVLPSVLAGPPGIDWSIEHRADYSQMEGSYEVVNYDPRYNLAIIGAEDIPAGYHNHKVIGMILSGGQTSDLGDFGSPTLTSTPASPTFPFPTSTITSYGNAPSANILEIVGPNYPVSLSVARMLSAVYMKETDSYAFLYLDLNNSLWIEKWSRYETNQLFRKQLSTGSSAILDGTMSWNGHHFCVLMSLDYLSTRPLVSLWLVSQNFTIEETQYLDLPLGGTNLDVFGNTHNQIPGPLYGPYIPASAQAWYTGDYAGGFLQPRPRKMHAQWNDKACRWVITVSYLWSLEGTAGRGTYGSPSNTYFNTGSRSLHDASLQNGPYKLFLWDGSSPRNPVSTMTGNVLNGKFYAPLVQPGMRIIHRTGHGSDGTDGPYYYDFGMTVLDVVGTQQIDAGGIANQYNGLKVDIDRSQLSASQLSELESMALICSLYVVPREDVVTWTVSCGSPAVLVQDADGVTLTDIEISGSYTDIAEEYLLASKPIWRSAGETVGNPIIMKPVASAGSKYVSSTIHKRDYTRSFLSPAGKIDTLQLSNVKSRTLIKYGCNPEPDNPRIFPSNKRRS